MHELTASGRRKEVLLLLAIKQESKRGAALGKAQKCEAVVRRPCRLARSDSCQHHCELEKIISGLLESLP